MQKLKIGSIEIESGTLLVSDPTYMRNDKWQCTARNVKCGKYNVFLYRVDEAQHGIIPALLLIQHETTGDIPLRGACELLDDICVDSGSAGIFDFEHYADNSIFFDESGAGKEVPLKGDLGSNWFSRALLATQTWSGAGLIPYGAVSKSGFGPGTYSCYVARPDGREIVMLGIDFWNDAEVCRDVGIPCA